VGPAQGDAVLVLRGLRLQHPGGHAGDNYDRFFVRIAEMYESVKIIEQALDGLPEGPYITEDRKVALPPRHELATSMEALIHHFKLVTEGFRVPPGEVYYPIEVAARRARLLRALGRLEQAGARAHARPVFVNLQATAPMVKDLYIADMIATLAAAGSRSSEGSTGNGDRPDTRAALRARLARPRLGRGRRPHEGPGEVPDPRPRRSRGAARADRGYMARYPDRRSAAIPALHAVQARYGWCTPEGIEQAACVMRLTPGYLTAVATFYDMLFTQPVGRHDVYVCTNISCSLCGADELLRGLPRARRRRPDFNIRAFECLGACDIAPMASIDGNYVGPIALDEVPTVLERAPRRGAAARAPARAPQVARPRDAAS
jgi:NADH:ubiquinone oxidoreductase subunit E